MKAVKQLARVGKKEMKHGAALWTSLLVLSLLVNPVLAAPVQYRANGTLETYCVPNEAAEMEMRDVATPVTWERYAGNWKGSFEGWLETTETLMMRIGKTLPGLKNFYMAGQWVEPGGSVPTAVISGRNVTQIICKQDKKKFIISTP